VRLEVLPDPAAAAARAAARVADAAREAVAERGRFVFAVSGGHSPWIMLRELAGEPLPWEKIHVFQVDERVAPAGSPDRNLTHLKESLLSRSALPEANVHAMPVETPDLDAAARDYARELERIAGSPPVLDVAHLGLGPDGHTASLVPGDPALGVSDRDVAVTAAYMGRRRMTLTYPVLDRARRVLWLVTGAEKAPVLPRLLRGDPSIPAGRVHAAAANVIADRAAAGGRPADADRRNGRPSP
jgi:6-phosphogluconolactonase